MRTGLSQGPPATRLVQLKSRLLFRGRGALRVLQISPPFSRQFRRSLYRPALERGATSGILAPWPQLGPYRRGPAVGARAVRGEESERDAVQAKGHASRVGHLAGSRPYGEGRAEVVLVPGACLIMDLKF